VPESPRPAGRRLQIKLAVLAGSIAAVLAAPAGAQALGFDPSATSVTPANLQGGAHSDVAIEIGFTDASDDIHDLTIGLPPGLVGDPNATPFCAAAALVADSCPANTIVGTATTNVTASGLPLTVNGNLYNVAPHAGEPAHFGIALHALPVTLPIIGDTVLPPIILESGVQLRTNDFGLNTIIDPPGGIPNQATVLNLLGNPVNVPIDITGMQITLDGTAPGTGKSFMRNPTSCGRATTTFSAHSYTGPTQTTPATGKASFTPTGCASIPFSPSFSALVGGVRVPGNQVPISTSIDQDVGEAGLRTAQVLTPADFGANIPTISTSCSQANFLAGACPPNFVVGSAIATSPLLSKPLTGPVLVVDSGFIPNIGLDLNGQLHFLLQGSLGLDNAVKFDGLPDIPISHFQLSFNGPPQGLLTANRDMCVPPSPVFHENFTGYNGVTSSVSSPSTVVGCQPLRAKKCKKAKKKRHKKKHRGHARAAKKHKHKKHKKKKCKRKHKKHRHKKHHKK
jgi:hypothetical protein